MTRILCGPLLVLVFVLSAAVLSPLRPAAKSTLNLPATPYRYANVELPAHFMQPGRNHDNTPPDNPLSDAGATLGRVLFYDTRLSANKDGNEHFFVPTPANTGLRGKDPTADGGVGDATLRAADLGSFKSPSLRNVEVNFGSEPRLRDSRWAV